MAADAADELAARLHRETGRSVELCLVAAKLLLDCEDTVEQRRAVQRALKLRPMLSLVRDAGDFYIDTASRAAGTEGVPGALVLELPRKANQPTEISFVGGKPEFRINP